MQIENENLYQRRARQQKQRSVHHRSRSKRVSSEKVDKTIAASQKKWIKTIAIKRRNESSNLFELALFRLIPLLFFRFFLGCGCYIILWLHSFDTQFYVFVVARFLYRFLCFFLLTSHGRTTTATFTPFAPGLLARIGELVAGCDPGVCACVSMCYF